MNYKQYIDLGFKRGELNDQVLFNQTGYTGFYLKYEFNKSTSIEVCNDRLNEPKLYINKDKLSSCFITTLTSEQVIELIKGKTK